MDTSDEIPVEEHRYFQARLHHLESQHPALLLVQLTEGTLTEHLREVTMRAMQAKGNLVVNKNMPDEQVAEWVMNRMVADPRDQSSPLRSASDRMKLRRLLAAYKATIPNLPMTYLSQSEIIE